MRRRSSISTSRQKPDDLLPLTPAVMYILLTLVDGPKHGYAIMHHERMLVVNQGPMAPGTLYGTVKRMLRDDLIAELTGHDMSTLGDVDSRRRYYKMTDFGWDVFVQETARLAVLYGMAKKYISG